MAMPRPPGAPAAVGRRAAVRTEFRIARANRHLLLFRCPGELRQV